MPPSMMKSGVVESENHRYNNHPNNSNSNNSIGSSTNRIHHSSNNVMSIGALGTSLGGMSLSSASAASTATSTSTLPMRPPSNINQNLMFPSNPPPWKLPSTTATSTSTTNSNSNSNNSNRADSLLFLDQRLDYSNSGNGPSSNSSYSAVLPNLSERNATIIHSTGSSGINNSSNGNGRASTPPPAMRGRKRGESIDQFLSRSPSQSLGVEFLKGIQQQHQQQVVTTSSSPSTGTTANSTSSRTSSPNHHHHHHHSSSHSSSHNDLNNLRYDRRSSYEGYTTHQHHHTNNLPRPSSYADSMSSMRVPVDTHQAAPHNRFDTFVPQEAANPHASHNNNNNHTIHNANHNNSVLSSNPHDVYAAAHHHHSNAANHSMHPSSAPESQQQQQQQQQVFYMAVPTQDGRGQVLQPIQMLQLPGQVPTFVLPNHPHLQQQQPPPPTQPTESHHNQSSGRSSTNIYNPTDINSSPYDPSKAPSYATTAENNNSNLNSNMVLLPPHDYNNMHNHKYTHHSNSMHNKAPVMTINNNSNNNSTTTNSTTTNSTTNNTTNSNSSDFISSLYTSTQRPPLRDLIGHVRRLSRDQVGCRLLQQSLDEEGTQAASMILKEGLTFWGEAMVDPFGNYLFQKILEKITAEERILLVQNVAHRLVNASLNLHGTRSVQKIVELCASDQANLQHNHHSHNPNNPNNSNPQSAAAVLTSALAPAAARLCIDSHGNHVIQRILLKLPYDHSKFVFDAVAASVGDVARHRHGCCVIQRCLDSPPSKARSHLVQRIVDKSLELMQDAYGNYVVQYVLDVCGDDHVHAVCESVVGRVCLLSIQKFSSNVMEKCLERCTDRVREQYLHELSTDSDRVRELMLDPFGNYVIQRALAVATHAQAVRLVEAVRPHLQSNTNPTTNNTTNNTNNNTNNVGGSSGGIRNTAGGRRIIAKISRRFPNFSISGGGLGEDQQQLTQTQQLTRQVMQHQQQPPQTANRSMNIPNHNHHPSYSKRDHHHHNNNNNNNNNNHHHSHNNAKQNDNNMYVNHGMIETSNYYVK